jgi:hypothetical protein
MEIPQTNLTEWVQARIAGFTRRGKAHRAGLPLSKRGIAANRQGHFRKLNLKRIFNEGLEIAEAVSFTAVQKSTGHNENFRDFIRYYCHLVARVCGLLRDQF